MDAPPGTDVMAGPEFTVFVILTLLVFVFLGLEIAIALGVTSFIGVAYLTGSLDIAFSHLSNTAYESLRNYVFAVVPLFILMGELVSRSGAAGDLYNLVNRAIRGLPGRLAIATVGGNAIFAAVTGVSIASAAAFTRIAYPEMVRHGYSKTVALGSIAGSASLGMLIPPSALMIVWGVITEESIGRLFLAGIVPGLLLAFMFAVFVIVFAVLRPDLFGRARESSPVPMVQPNSGPEALVAGTGGGGAAATQSIGAVTAAGSRAELAGATGILSLIALVLGGIWLGWFTPTEAAGIGALAALCLAFAKGMRAGDVFEAIMATGRTSAPILFLLITAQMYTRLLALGGIVDTVQGMLLTTGLGATGTLAIMVLIWFLLGMFIDSVSIILLTVPIFAPVAAAVGFDAIAFAIMGIVAIEAGLLTPPFGLCVYTVKSCVNDPEVRLSHIFLGSAPYWVILLVLVAVIAAFPSLATWLPSTML